ncbi:MAG TPA: STAS domain-containing protein [Vicinamibacteria bacterium]
MQLLFERSGDVHIVRVKEAKLTYPVLSSFLAEVRGIVEEGARKVVLDLEGVTYIDSAWIGCLMTIHRLLDDRDGAVKLIRLQPRVETMLSMTGVHKIVDFYREEAEALAAYGQPSQPPAGAPKSEGRWTEPPFES